MRQKNKSKVRDCHLALQFPHTIDLNQRMQINRQVQSLFGEFVAGLLSGGKPLTIAVSVQRLDKLATDQDRVLLHIFWTEGELEDVHIFKDMSLPARCLDCGQCHPEEAECPSEIIQ